MQKLAALLTFFIFLAACANKTEKAQQKDTSITTSNSSMNIQKDLLKAKGQNPDWTLEMSNDKSVTFMAEDTKFSGKIIEVIASNEGKMLTFMTDASASLYFNLIPKASTYTVQVVQKDASEKEKMYSGDGVVLGNFRLNGNWTLSSLNGKTVTQGDDTPNLNIGLFNEKLFGFTGCNRIMGSVNLDDQSQVNFGMINMTRMACIDDKYESLMMTTLKSEDVNVSLTDNGQMKITGGKNELLFDAK